MVHEFKLPDVGEGVAEGELLEWLVEEGDPVSEDQPVAEVETDKAVVDVPSPVDGTVHERRATEGEMVDVGSVFITFALDGEEPAAGDTDAETGESEGDADGATADVGAPDGRVFAAPTARRLARELGVDIASVEGSGPGGRVTDADVRAAAEDGETPSEAEAAVAEAEEPIGEPDDAEMGTATEAAPTTEAPEAASRDRTLAAPATRRLAEEEGVDLNEVPAVDERDGEAFVTPEAVREYATAQRAAQEADAAAAQEFEPSREDERIPYRGVRRTIGEAMERSKYTAPHVTHQEMVDVTELVETREELKPVAEERGIKLTYMPFVMKAVIAALDDHPVLNATLDEDAGEIVLRGDRHIGVAVATEAGLMVPVVEDVDRKGMLQLASETHELAQKARDRTISPDELQGSTFTITNFGAFGGDYATPVINYPEVAILGMGELKQRPMVVDGEVEARYSLPISISIDHRVVDGADVAQFAGRLATYLSEPRLLLLE